MHEIFHVPPGRGLRTHRGDYISQLAREFLSVPSDKLEKVNGEGLYLSA